MNFATQLKLAVQDLDSKDLSSHRQFVCVSELFNVEAAFYHFSSSRNKVVRNSFPDYITSQTTTSAAIAIYERKMDRELNFLDFIIDSIDKDSICWRYTNISS